MFPGFTTARVETAGALINLRRGGKGPPLLLLHGYPQTHAMWHKMAPALAERLTVICPDLRGYGDSSKPPGGADHAGYAKRAMAADQIEVMEKLGFRRFQVAGHDRGARVVHRMCLDYPERVERAAVLDIVPTAIWREKAADVQGHALPCGHFLPEEAPEETLAALGSFPHR